MPSTDKPRQEQAQQIPDEDNHHVNPKRSQTKMSPLGLIFIFSVIVLGVWFLSFAPMQS